MRKTKLSDEEVKKISTADRLRDIRDGGYGRLKNYSYGGNRVEMKWNLNKYAKADQIFELTIGSERALLDAEELQKLLRWV